jgi:hypothetical protein
LLASSSPGAVLAGGSVAGGGVDGSVPAVSSTGSEVPDALQPTINAMPSKVAAPTGTTCERTLPMPRLLPLS